MQTTKNILMVRPSNFTFNSDTASSNSFQSTIDSLDEEEIKQKALSEFETLAATLKSKGVNVFVFDDTPNPIKPDAIFPNNWVTFHPDGTVILYPMFAFNRRDERRRDILDALRKDFKIASIVDFSYYENEQKFLEGTGSIVFDHANKIAYACLSPRTNKEIFIKVSEYLQYTPTYFHSRDRNGKEIYHANVLMCIGEGFSVICLASITDKKEKEIVANSLKNTRHEVIEISLEQMHRFAGNMLALQTKDNSSILALSQNAFNALTEIQKQTMSKYCEFVPLAITTIETIGGGSARCMIAEIFLEQTED